MSFRTNRGGIKGWGEEKTYTICITTYRLYKISHLHLPTTHLVHVRNDKIPN